MSYQTEREAFIAAAMSCALCGIAGVSHASAIGCIELLQRLLRAARIDADEQRLIGYGEGIADVLAREKVRFSYHDGGYYCDHPGSMEGEYIRVRP